MDIDLDSLSEKELKELRAGVDRALSTLETRRRAEARRAAEEAAAKLGFSLNDLVATGGKTNKSKSPAKYRNPADPTQTWSGRGRQPGWIKEAMAAGRSMDEFAI